MRVIVTGSRDWWDFEVLDCVLSATFEGDGPHVLVHGACPTGADAMADEWVRQVSDQLAITVERHPADWERLGKRAGFARNAEMINLGADECVAFIRNNSRGASHTARLAQAAHMVTSIFRDNDQAAS